MDTVGINLHRFGDQLLVELISDAGRGNVTAQTFEFDIEDPDRGYVSVRGSLPKDVQDAVRDELDSAGFTLVEGRQLA